MKEKWRLIPEFYPYAISNLGHIGNFKTRKILKSYQDLNGYLVAFLRRPGQRQTSTLMVHCLVANHFIGPRPDGHQINHKDGNKTNPNVNNLEYVTPKENVRHARGLGLVPDSTHKLTSHHVVAIRALAGHGHSKLSISRLFRISQTHTKNIINRKRWTHI